MRNGVTAGACWIVRRQEDAYSAQATPVFTAATANY